MMEKGKIIEGILGVNSELTNLLYALEEENNDDKQFDYVSSPRLSDAVDMLVRKVKAIEKIVYQAE